MNNQTPIKLSGMMVHDPFGMITVGRSWEVGSGYRYGFNGQEQDDDISGAGNLNTAEFWEYDTRLGRRWNLDPIDQIYNSNYSCFANNSLIFIDTKGDKLFFHFEGQDPASDRTLLEAQINKGLGGYYTAKIDATSGEVTLTVNTDKDLTTASAEIIAFHGVIEKAASSPTDIKIGVVNTNSSISTGNYEQSKIDVGDLDAIDNMKNDTGLPNVATSASKLGHEISEQIYKQENGFEGSEGYDAAHYEIGIPIENSVIGNDIERIPEGDGTDFMTGTNTQTFKIKKKIIQFRMTEVPDTPGQKGKTFVRQIVIKKQKR